MAKPWKIPNLNTDSRLESCLPKILNARFNEMLSYKKGTIEGSDIEYLHNMRISSRRIQAVLKAFRDYYHPKKFKKEFLKLQTLIRALGIVRHYDVFIDMLENYKNSIDADKKDSIELLIIRQSTLRKQKRKELVNTLRVLDRNKFEDSFRKFISTSQ